MIHSNGNENVINNNDNNKTLENMENMSSMKVEMAVNTQTLVLIIYVTLRLKVYPKKNNNKREKRNNKQRYT